MSESEGTTPARIRATPPALPIEQWPADEPIPYGPVDAPPPPRPAHLCWVPDLHLALELGVDCPTLCGEWTAPFEPQAPHRIGSRFELDRSTSLSPRPPCRDCDDVLLTELRRRERLQQQGDDRGRWLA